MIKEITAQNYASEVENSDKPVILDFWAEWCGPCRMLSPIIDEIADERDDIVVGKVNVDEQGDLATKFGIISIPTVILVKGGKPVTKSIGYREKEGLLDALGL
ncbi:MAG: thioredoxin [Clostridia bacterium]|nr:thioredoxin [Clostridia bacterium]